MSELLSNPRSHNPFSTRCVRPGALGFVFPPGENVELLVDRLAACGWRGQIVGPHGSGKSSLLAALRPVLEARGRRLDLFTLHDGERELPRDLSDSGDMSPSTLVVVDGYEQLSRWSRWRLRRLCARHSWGLVVTTHTSVDFPTVFTTGTSLELADELVARLQPGAAIRPEDVRSSFAKQQGDLREVLFELYDLYEQRRPRP